MGARCPSRTFRDSVSLACWVWKMCYIPAQTQLPIMVIIQTHLAPCRKIRVVARLDVEESRVIITSGTGDEHSDGRLAESHDQVI
jgi:hypothetical protein